MVQLELLPGLQAQAQLALDPGALQLLPLVTIPTVLLLEVWWRWPVSSPVSSLLFNFWPYNRDFKNYIK
jgi:hypothetical protein